VINAGAGNVSFGSTVGAVDAIGGTLTVNNGADITLANSVTVNTAVQLTGTGALTQAAGVVTAPTVALAAGNGIGGVAGPDSDQFSLASTTISATNGFYYGVPSSNVQNGNKLVSPAGTTTYVITAYGNGYSSSKNITVQVNNLPQACSIDYFTASPNPINPNQTSVLSWNTTGNCISAYISSGVGNVSLPDGSKVVSPTDDTTYTLTVYSPGYWQADSESVTVVVNNNTNTTGTLTPDYTSCAIPLNSSTCTIPFSWHTYNPAPGATSAITRDGGITVATGNSGYQSFVIPYSSATFYLYNNANLLDTSTVTSNCTSGTSWTS